MKRMYPGNGKEFPDRCWTSPELAVMSFFVFVPKKLRAEKKWRKKNGQLIKSSVYKKLAEAYEGIPF